MKDVPFRYEKEMAEPVSAWLRQQRLQVKPEFQMPWGICDLVGCSLDPGRVRQRLQLGQRQPIGPLLRIGIWWQVPERESAEATTVDRLEKDYEGFIDRSVIRKEVACLVARKFVQEGPSGRLQRLNGWYPLHEKIVAVEVKLNRVSEALSQAKATMYSLR